MGRRLFQIVVVSFWMMESAYSAVITWGTAQDITDDSDIPVALAGSVHSAYNIGDTGGVAPVTINGITFGTDTLVSGAPQNSSFASGVTGLSSEYQTLLNYTRYSMGSAVFTGLTVNQTYTLQLWANDSRGYTPIPARTTRLRAGSVVTIDQNTTDISGGTGQYVFGTFVADATSQTVSLENDTAAGMRVLNAAVVYNGAVPEPSSVGLIALVSIGSLMARRMILRRR